MSRTRNYLLTVCLLIGSSVAPYLANAEPSMQKFRALDDVFVFPEGGCKFNSDLWKQDPDSRFTMLFDLYHKLLKNSTPDQIYQLLGQPVEAKSEIGGGQTALYDLGLQDGVKTLLSLWFKNDALQSLAIQERSDTGFAQGGYYPDWQRENLSWSTLAEEYNRHYFLVGMPAKLISSVVGYKPTDSSSYKDKFEKTADTRSDSDVHCFGPFEFQYTQDNEKVKRFRIAYSSDAGSCRFTDWEDRELRTDRRCRVRQSDYSDLIFRPAEPLLSIGIEPFSKDAWNGNERHFNRRFGLVNGLVRSYPVVGMTRREIADLLGSPCKAGCSVDETNPLSDDREYYQLTASGCGMTGENFLELAYASNQVLGYRVIHTPRSGYGVIKTVSGTSFGFD